MPVHPERESLLVARGVDEDRPAPPHAVDNALVPGLVSARGSLTTGTITWAITSLRRQHATIQGLARQLGVGWWTLWRVMRPELERLDAAEARFVGVTSLGVDEHVWHHEDPRKKGPKELTGMVDLTRDENGRVHARLLDLVPGRSK